ncbi:hypothetical protein CAP35_15245 [Chitinophagaceae bacterium IBVUCB1]|nr:hypothetical protein CAP35_15245 [Chitinophagaceae bacterium IBVUCB1]
MQQYGGLQTYIGKIVQAWRAELLNKVFRWKLLVVPGLFLIYSAITQHLGNYIETRKGVRLEDKLLSFFPSYDFSTIIFILLYTSLFALILTHLHKPKTIMRLIEMHFMVAIVRQVCILLIALEPPTGIIVLRDVFLENTVYPHNSPLTKDLFFSGHVASIWIYFLCAQHRYLKAWMFAATFVMSFMVLSMRIHYTYDVYGALFFTTLLYFAPSRVRPYYTKVKEQLLFTK